jgi:dolichyl-phosphate beta-glucosyltransferase
MFLSIIIPAYNEEKRIGPTLAKIYSFLKNKEYSYEVLVVDDGSSDNTVQEVQKSNLFSENKLKIISNGINRGKGFSVKNGILNSSAEFVLISDADLSTPIEESDKLSAYLDKGFDIIIGSRGAQDSDIRIRQPWHRERMGRIFNFFIKKILFLEFDDTQCGFKLFKAPAAKNIAAQLCMDGFSFDVEMLYLAKKGGYKIAEVGVIWNNSPQSTVKLLSSSLNMFFDLFKIKQLHK